MSISIDNKDERSVIRFHNSSPSRLIDKQKMSALDRKCTKAQNFFRLWRAYDLDPNKFPGRDVAKAKADFAKADAKRKALRLKLKHRVLEGEIYCETNID